MRRTLLSLLLLSGCTVPPPESYVAGGAGRPDQAVDLGTNTVGETCVQGSQPGASGTEIYCGAWQQPSGRVRSAGAGTASSLNELAAAGPWRTTLEANYSCAAPRPVSLGGEAALQLDCTRRSGGWPHVAVVVASGGQAWLGDGVVSALPAIQRSIAVLSGRAPATIISSAAVNARQAERQGARARETGDVREFDTLMLQGARANLADDPVAAESAYSAALAVQEKALGKDNPNVADPAMHVALQLSNQGRFAEADALFARAEKLAPRQQGDITLPARLDHYEGLHAVNQGKLDAGLGLLRKADAGYTRALPPDALKARPRPAAKSFASNVDEVVSTPLDRQTRGALLGLVETRRYEGVVLRQMGRNEESAVALRSAAEIARNARLEQPEVVARLARSTAIAASASGNGADAIGYFSDSSSAFNRAYPGSRPLALVGLLHARELVQGGKPEAAIPVCRSAIKVLVEIKSAFEPERMTGCLDAFAAAAAVTPAGPARQALLADMFLASQLVRGSTTSQQIQQASARLGEGSKNSKVGEAIRAQQDASARLLEIRRRREAVAQAQRDNTPLPGDAKRLEEEEKEASSQLANKESELQAAAPNYDQLIQQATPAADVLKLLRPGEAFAAITLTQDGGWTFLLRDGMVQVGRVRGGSAVIDPLVTRIRKAMEPDLPAFDAPAAQQLYQTVFGGVAAGMDGVQALSVAPMGSLLSLPFAVLLTGPADPAALAKAPWLIRRMAIGHVPSPGNFVALRRISGNSQATRPWFGFGDFRPVTLAQARKTFPASCGDSAELLAHLPKLPSALKELAVASKLLGAGPGDELLGPAFTAPAVERTNLSDVRVLHFATHAILPSELKCQTEPAIVASAPPGAKDASGALLTASDLAQIKLDADVVILSACNSGGPDGKTGGGESLSTLARSFFYGGARSLLITHWEVSDQAATFIVADTLRRTRAEPNIGIANALRNTQVGILDRVGTAMPAEFAHPFFWAPFALIGQAGVPGAAAGART